MINDKLLKQIRQSNDYYWRFGSHCIFDKKDQIKKGKTYIDPTSPKYRIAGKDVYVEQMSDKEIKEEFIKLIQPKALDKHKFEERNRDGYTPLFDQFEGFYLRNMYRRQKIVFYNIIGSVPGAMVTYVERISDDAQWTFRLDENNKKYLGTIAIFMKITKIT